jgi:hypothetical protein
MKRFNTIQECIEQLEKCGYEANDGHPLKDNIAFVQIKELSQVNNLQLPAVIKKCETCSKFKECKIVESCKERGLAYCKYFVPCFKRTEL